MSKKFSIILSSCLLLLSVTSCSTRESSKKVTEEALEVIDGISDALKDRGKETGEKATDGLGEVGKGVGKSLGKLLTENVDTIGKFAGEILGKGSTALIEGLQNSLYSPVEFENGKQNFIDISYMGISTVDKRVVVFSDNPIEENNRIEITCFDNSNKQIQVLQGSFPNCSQLGELTLNQKELNLFKSAHRRVVTTRQVLVDSAQMAE